MTWRSVAVEYEQTLLNRYALASFGRSAAIERSAYILLTRLAVRGPMSIGELSEALVLDASTLRRQTAAAMKAGLVDRIPDPAGGMARKFRISRKGSAALTSERENHLAALDDILSDWSDTEIAEFAAGLRRFNASIERRVAQSWPRT